MNKILIFTILIIANLKTNAASSCATDTTNSGIDFLQARTWKEVIAKARLEHKFIFVDCYATWCGPCKKMEKEVYSQGPVGHYFNANFISVKVQMDSSQVDNAFTRAFYADARNMAIKYKIAVYPTMLFFNPGGNIMKSIYGVVPSDELIKVGMDVKDPDKDYYTLLDQYRKGKRDLNKMAFLAQTTQQLLSDSILTQEIIREYFRLMNKNDWFSKRNIEFIHQFVYGSMDTCFSFFFQNTDTIDKIMGDEEYVQALIQSIIYKEIAQPAIRKSDGLKIPPDWAFITATIRQKYNSYYADRVTLGAMVDWSQTQKDWVMRTQCLVRYVDQFGPKTDTGGKWQAFRLNLFAWDIFQHSNDSVELAKAVQWSSRAVFMDPTPENIDTYANLEYKLKRIENALKWEAIAFKLNDGNRLIETNFQSMKNGHPTWETNEK